MIKQYAVAKCSLGVLGIITSTEMEEVTYSDGNKGVAWTGFVVEPTQIEGIKGNAGKIIDVKVGNLWCSKRPEVVKLLEKEDCEENGIFSLDKTLKND